MHHPPLIFLFFSVVPHFFIRCLVAAAGADPAAYQSLTKLDAFGALLPCARTCFGYFKDCCSCDKVAAVLGCDFNCAAIVSGAPNSCYCRADRIATANSYISACVKSQCGGVGDYRVDLSSASDLYNGYCTSMGYSAVTVTTADDTSSASKLATVGLPTNTGTSPAGSTASSSSPPSTHQDSSTSTGSGGGLSGGAIAAIALGVILAVGVLIQFAIWQVQRDRRAAGGYGGGPMNDAGLDRRRASSQTGLQNRNDLYPTVQGRAPVLPFSNPARPNPAIEAGSIPRITYEIQGSEPIETHPADLDKR